MTKTTLAQQVRKGLFRASIIWLAIKACDGNLDEVRSLDTTSDNPLRAEAFKLLLAAQMESVGDDFVFTFADGSQLVVGRDAYRCIDPS